mmetsp:Transcript_47363/g.122862  ORF Transcript_47363/g.122862 Transcript_47363/m.122862 type:complete len:203 (-) Transcript_47363:126-734(-)
MSGVRKSSRIFVLSSGHLLALPRVPRAACSASAALERDPLLPPQLAPCRMGHVWAPASASLASSSRRCTNVFLIEGLCSIPSSSASGSTFCAPGSAGQGPGASGAQAFCAAGSAGHCPAWLTAAAVAAVAAGGDGVVPLDGVGVGAAGGDGAESSATSSSSNFTDLRGSAERAPAEASALPASPQGLRREAEVEGLSSEARS